MAQLTFTIPDDKVAQLLEEFIADVSITVDADGLPIMSEVNWVKKDIISHVMTRCRRGRAKLLMQIEEQEPDLIS